MSLDLSLECQHCGSCLLETFNYTYNASPMWYAIFPEDTYMVQIDGMSGDSAIYVLNVAIKRMEEQENEIRNVDMSGSYSGFLEFLRTLLIASEKYPKGVWRAYR